MTCHTFNPVTCQFLDIRVLAAGDGGGGGGGKTIVGDPEPSKYRLGSRDECVLVLYLCPFPDIVVNGRAMFRGMMSP